MRIANGTIGIVIFMIQMIRDVDEKTTAFGRAQILKAAVIVNYFNS